MKRAIIVTNNPLVRDTYQDRLEVQFIEGGILDVFHHVRDMIHAGHEMLSHPLSGSIKPGETIYKSVMVDRQKKSLNMDSLLILEDAHELANHLIEKGHDRPMDEQIYKDLQFIDLTLIESALF